jgi:hypothetical protein
MPMLLHYSGMATKGYGCNRVRGQFTFDDAERAGEEISATIRSVCSRNLSEPSWPELACRSGNGQRVLPPHFRSQNVLPP